MAPLRDHYKSEELRVACKAGGIKAAGSTTGLEVGTGEPERMDVKHLSNVDVRNGRANCRIPFTKCCHFLGTDASVVVLIVGESQPERRGATG